MSFGTIATFILYIVAMLAIGVICYRRNRNLNDFILGSRGLNPGVAALSAGASDMSGWLLLGLPGAVYASGLNQMWIAVGLVIGAYLNWQFVAARLRNLHAGGARRAHHPRLSRQPLSGPVADIARAHRGRHSFVLHHLRLGRARRRRSAVRTDIRLGLSAGGMGRLAFHRGLRLPRRFSRRVLDRHGSGHHDVHRPSGGADRRDGRGRRLGRVGRPDRCDQPQLQRCLHRYDHLRHRLVDGLGPRLLRTAAYSRPFHGGPHAARRAAGASYQHRLDGLRPLRRHLHRLPGDRVLRAAAARQPGDGIHPVLPDHVQSMDRGLPFGCHSRCGDEHHKLPADRLLQRPHRGSIPPILYVRGRASGNSCWSVA